MRVRKGRHFLSVLLIFAMFFTLLPMPAVKAADSGTAEAYFFQNNSVTSSLAVDSDGSVTFDISAYPYDGYEQSMGNLNFIRIYSSDGGGDYTLLNGTKRPYGGTWNSDDPGYIVGVKIPNVKKGTYSVQLKTSKGNSFTHQDAVTIGAAADVPVISTTSLPDGIQGVPYSAALTGTSKDGSTLTWSLASGALPSGLLLSEAGVISGTPTGSGTYTFSVSATQADGKSSKKSLSISIDLPKLHTVSFYLCGGTGADGADYSKKTDITSGTKITLPAAPVRRGYTFNGWSVSNADTLYAPGASFTVAANVSFWAEWTKKNDITVNLPSGMQLTGYVYLIGEYYSGTSLYPRSSNLYTHYFTEAESLESITIPQKSVYDRSYHKLSLQATVDGEYEVIAEYYNMSNPVTEDTESVDLTGKYTSLFPLSSVEVPGLKKGIDYSIDYVKKSGVSLYFPSLTAQDGTFTVKLHGLTSSSYYNEYVWDKEYTAERNGDRLIVNLENLAGAVPVTLSMNEAYCSVTATQQTGAGTRSVTGSAGANGKASILLVPGYDASLSVQGCYITAGDRIAGTDISSGMTHDMTVKGAVLNAEVTLTAESDEELVKRYVAALNPKLSLVSEAGKNTDNAQIILYGTQGSGVMSLNNTGNAAAIEASLNGQSIIAPGVKNVTLNEGNGEVSFEAELHPGILVPLKAETTGSYFLAWYGEDKALAGMSGGFTLGEEDKDIAVRLPADKAGNDLTGTYTLVLMSSVYEGSLMDTALDELTGDEIIKTWTADIRKNTVTLLDSFTVDTATSRNAVYVTKPNSTLKANKDTFNGEKDTIIFSGEIGLDEGLTDGKVSYLYIDPRGAGTGYGNSSTIKRLLIGGVSVPIPQPSGSGVYNIELTSPVELPCDYSIYCEPGSLNWDMHVSVSAQVEYRKRGVKRYSSYELIGEYTVGRPGSSLKILSSYVCSERVNVSGTARKNEVVIIYDNDHNVGRTISGSDGRWSALVPLYNADLNPAGTFTVHELYAVTGSGVTSETRRIIHQSDGPELKSFTMSWNEGSWSKSINVGDAYVYHGLMENVTFKATFENDDKLTNIHEKAGEGEDESWEVPVVFKVYTTDGSVRILECTEGTDGVYSASIDETLRSSVTEALVLYNPDPEKMRSSFTENADGSRTLKLTEGDASSVDEVFSTFSDVENADKGSLSIDFSEESPKAETKNLSDEYNPYDDPGILKEIKENLESAGFTEASYDLKYGDDTKGLDEILTWIGKLDTKRPAEGKVLLYSRSIGFNKKDVYNGQKKAVAGISDDHISMAFPEGSKYSYDRYSITDAEINEKTSDLTYTWCVVCDFYTDGEKIYNANITAMLMDGFKGFGREIRPVSSMSSTPGVLAAVGDNYEGQFEENNDYDSNSALEGTTNDLSFEAGVANYAMETAKIPGGGAISAGGTALTAVNTYLTVKNSADRWNNATKMYSDLSDLLISPCYRKIMDSSLGQLAENAVDNFRKSWNKYSVSDGLVTVTSTAGNVVSTALGFVPHPAAKAASLAVSGGTWAVSKVGGEIVNKDYKEMVQSYETQYKTIKRLFRRHAQKTNDPDCIGAAGDGGGGGGGSDGDGGGNEVSNDPSGVVYEGVIENPVENAKVSLWYAADSEGSMVYEGYENNIASIESAAGMPGLIPAESTQETDANGHYEWGVPEGLWFVTAESGSFTGSSEEDRAATSVSSSSLPVGQGYGSHFLPVPPVQLDVNIPIKDTSAPMVEDVECTTDGILLTYSRYMMESGDYSALNAKYYTITSDEEMEIETVTPVKEGHAPSNIDENETVYVKTVLVKTKDPMPQGVPVTISVSADVRSYANVNLGSVYTGGGLTEAGKADDEEGEGIWIKGLKDSYVYTGFPITPNIDVYHDSTVLRAGREYKVSFKNNTKAGTGTLAINGKLDYKGKLEKDINITAASLSADNEAVTAYKDSQGKITVYYNGQKLKEKKDYTVGDNKSTITGNLNFTGSRTVTDDLPALTPISKAVIDIPKTMDYTGEEVKPQITVKTKEGNELKEDTHYKLMYSSNVNAGTATVRIIGLEKEGYTGVVKKSFKILPLSLKSDSIYIERGSSEYTKSGAKASYVTGYFGSLELREGVDFSIKYTNNKKVGKEAVLTVKGLGNFKDSLKDNFCVSPTNIEELDISVSAKQYKAGKTAGYYVGKPVIYDFEGKALSPGKDFKYDIILNSKGQVIEKTDPIGEDEDSIYIVVTGNDLNGFYGETEVKCLITKDAPTEIKKAKVSKILPQEYTGKAIEPEISLSIKNEQLKEYRDYEITGMYSNVKRGKGIITVNGLGSYTGSMTVTFKIVPMKLDGSSQKK